ncbi:ATP-binding protein [Flagellatimonas centrodinii]|uniref:ATP-binding protein n=1 Tax=Flagellatimonas centrodinii TaxID=2806210 RepID=UPI001FEE2EDF|nr:ATP-binding protein [Flagellatimonas centrodinii]ULQ45464.1 ATP-binding protein [Flagellatimonas centrodinii]
MTDLGQGLAFRWARGALTPVTPLHQVDPASLIGIDRQKQAFFDNLQQFVHRHPANHTLLTGARGTGKSSLVKAALHLYGDSGLRLVEVSPHDLTDLPDIVAPLRERQERFVLYVDDFSVSAQDHRLTALKTALDGGLEAPPENMLIVATSNRRYLLPTVRSDNDEFHWEDGELHPGESTEEKISLSERFGLWLSFQPFSQDQYLEAVGLHLQQMGAPPMDNDTRTGALRWALSRGSRSGRVAQQFARHHAGQHRLQAP